MQIVLDTFGGMRNGIEHGTHYRYHWSPTLALLWPLLASTHSVFALQLVQVAANVAVGPLLYALVVPRAGPRIALRVAILALIYPPLLAVSWGEFHDVGVFAPLALGSLVAADRRRWIWFWICITLACGLREDICLELVIVGSALGCAGWRSRGAWLGAALLALVTLSFYYGFIIPRVGGHWLPGHFYVYPFAQGPATVVIALIVHPLQSARTFLTFGRLTYVLEALVPLAFLPLFSSWSLLALPGFAIVLLANSGLVYHMGNHYAALWIPWLLAATAFAAAQRTTLRWCNAAFALSALVLAFFNPLHPAHFLKANYHTLSDARKALACVPPAASVSTHDEWFSVLAMDHARATLGTIDGVDYLVFADDFPNAEFTTVVRPRLQAEVARGSYREICRYGSVVTYRRAGKNGAL